MAAAEMAANTRCHSVVVLDLRGRSPVAEFFVIATGTSAVQMRAVANEISDLGERMDYKTWHSSGYEGAKWIVVDAVHVVVHIFDAPSRDFYDLEVLWGDAPKIDWRAALGLPPEPPRMIASTPLPEVAEAESADLDIEAEEAIAEAADEEESEAPTIKARVAKPAKPAKPKARKVAAKKAPPRKKAAKAPARKAKPAKKASKVAKAKPRPVKKAKPAAKRPAARKPVAKKKPAPKKKAAKKPAAGKAKSKKK